MKTKKQTTWGLSSRCCKAIFTAAMATVMLFTMTACGGECAHNWSEATCTMASTCSKCGAVQGEKAEHTYSGKSCTGTDSCIICGTVLPATGHTWVEATCIEPKICNKCEETEGEPLGHDLQDGTCKRCGEIVWTTLKQTGKGDKTIQDIVIGYDFYALHVTHDGSGEFKLTMKDSAGGEALLIQTKGAYDGTVLMYGASPVSFDIKASGSWTYAIDKITASETAEFSGKGDGVATSAAATNGKYHITHDGSGTFYVYAFIPGSALQVVAPTTGAYNADVQVDVPDGTTAIFEVHANGNWTIKPAA